MRRGCKRIFLIVLFVAFTASYLPSMGLCQTALNASQNDRVYTAIDIFISHGLVNNVIIGQRPYSRLEVARILREVRKQFSTKRTEEIDSDWKSFGRDIGKNNYIERLLEYYEREYSRELEGMSDGFELDVINQADFQLYYNSSTPRLIPPSNSQGGINGLITSFDRYVPGFTYEDGSNAYLTTHHEIYATPYLAISVEPRFLFQDSRNGQDDVNATFHRLYLTAGWRNIQLEAGRDNILWGQGEYGGLMLSSNARPLDLIKLTNPYPWRAPWVFKYLGHMQFTLFVSNLGADREFPYSYFYGLKFSLRPCRYFEFGLSHTIITAGKGAPKLSFWDPVTELMPFHKWGASNIGASNTANNAFGFLDFRITIPQLRGVSLYYDAYIEDSIIRAFRLPDNILNQMSFITGVYLPRITDSGAVGARLEYHHIAPLSYRHSPWVTGYTLNQRPMGDPLGPTADGIYATVFWFPRPSYKMRFDLAYEDYDSSFFYTEANSDGGGDRILLLSSGPHERRIRAVGGIEWRVKKRYGLSFDAGYENIQNWNFEVGRSVNNMLLGAKLSLYFGNHSRAYSR